MRPNNLKEFFPERYALRLAASKDVEQIFELVRDAVKEHVGVVRAGLELGMAELEEVEGKMPCALHPLNCNLIVINRKAVDLVKDRCPGLLRSLLFHSLLFEYLQTIGLDAETEVEGRVLEISLALFGDEHPVTKMAEDLPRTVPGLAHAKRMALREGVEIASTDELVLPA